MRGYQPRGRDAPQRGHRADDDQHRQHDELGTAVGELNSTCPIAVGTSVNAGQSKLRTPAVSGEAVMNHRTAATIPATPSAASTGCQNRRVSSRRRASTPMPHSTGNRPSTARLNNAFGWARPSAGSVRTRVNAAPPAPITLRSATPTTASSSVRYPGSSATPSRFGHSTPNDMSAHGSAVNPVASTGAASAAPDEGPMT